MSEIPGSVKRLRANTFPTTTKIHKSSAKVDDNIDKFANQKATLKDNMMYSASEDKDSNKYVNDNEINGQRTQITRQPSDLIDIMEDSVANGQRTPDLTNKTTESQTENTQHEEQNGLHSPEQESLLGHGSNEAVNKVYEYDKVSSSVGDIPTPPDGGWGWVVCMGK